MAWQEDSLPGELNGTRIYVTRRGYRFGRETELHVFTGRDEPFSEDTGAKPEYYEVDFVVAGNDYMIARDEVVDILSKPGPYTYVDPTFGDVQVSLDSEVRVEERFDGVAAFSCTFHRAGSLSFVILVEPSAEVERVAAVAAEKIEKSYKPKIGLAAAILRALGLANSFLRVAKGKIASKLGVLDKISNEISQLEDNIQDLIDTPQRVANAFKRIGASIKSLVQVWKQSKAPKIPGGRERDFDDLAIDAITEMLDDLGGLDMREDEVDTTTPDGVTEQENTKQTADMFKQTMLVVGIETLAGLEPATSDKAAAVKDQVADLAAEILSDPDIDTDVYDALADLVAAFIDYQVTTGQDLPNERTFYAQQPTPACVVAQEVYTDGARDSEVILRNNPRHPLFMQGEVRVFRE